MVNEGLVILNIKKVNKLNELIANKCEVTVVTYKVKAFNIIN